MTQDELRNRVVGEVHRLLRSAPPDTFVHLAWRVNPETYRRLAIDYRPGSMVLNANFKDGRLEIFGIPLVADDRVPPHV